MPSTRMLSACPARQRSAPGPRQTSCCTPWRWAPAQPNPLAEVNSPPRTASGSRFGCCPPSPTCSGGAGAGVRWAPSTRPRWCMPSRRSPCTACCRPGDCPHRSRLPASTTRAMLRWWSPSPARSTRTLVRRWCLPRARSSSVARVASAANAARAGRTGRCQPAKADLTVTYRLGRSRCCCIDSPATEIRCTQTRVRRAGRLRTAHPARHVTTSW